MWSSLLTCFGYETVPRSELLHKANLILYSKMDQPDEEKILYEIEKMMEFSSYYDIDRVVLEFKNLGINNIWLYAEKRTGDQVLLLPNSSFGKRFCIKVFVGSREDFLKKIPNQVQNLEHLREGGFPQIK